MLAAACDGLGLLRLIDAEGEKPALGDEEAKRMAFFVAAPFGCAVVGPSFFSQLSLTQELDR